jgi:hypothetical protein
MTARGSLARFAPARIWARLDPASRVVVGLGLLALIGPFGEIMDVAVFAEIEADFIAFDFGLEALVTLLLPIYYLALLLLLMAAARRIAEFSCARPLPVLRIASRHPGPPEHVPIV